LHEQARRLFNPLERVAETVPGNDDAEDIEKEIYFEHCAQTIAEEMPNSENQ
jgi:hypothetical protein